MRKFIKQFFPFDIQRLYMQRTYGIFISVYLKGRRPSPIVEVLIGMLPYGLVRLLFDVRPDNKRTSPLWMKLCEPGYRFTRIQHTRFMNARLQGLRDCKELIEKNKNARILVILHLFYPKSWNVIKMYLDNLKPYMHTHFVVTYVSGTLSSGLLKKIRAYSSNVDLLPCPNMGFDVGPFVEALQTIDLREYDIVFKLQSKGIKRPSIFIYGQVFKYSDWFFNLWDGVLDGNVVHREIDRLLADEIKMSAAENLIVQDPVHKCNFVRKFCRELSLPYVENYRYIAGSMFAARANILTPLRSLRLGCKDFGETVRGKFSIAHFLERWMCFAAQDALYGFPVTHNEYSKEVLRKKAVSAMRLQDDPRIKLDDDFFYRRLETRSIRGYEIMLMKLKDIKRLTYDGRIVPLEECEPYRYLLGEAQQYSEYCDRNRTETGFEMSQHRFDSLLESMSEGYDSRYMPVVKGRNNILMDGQHRCCWLLYKYGPEHAVNVLKLI